MKKERSLIVIDTCSRRRAAISFSFAQSNTHIEPYEGVHELTGHWNEHCAILAFDEGDTLDKIFAAMSEAGLWYPVIAYSQNPSIERIVNAMHEGTVDYLAWPWTPGQLECALDRAIARSSRIENIKLRESFARNRVERLTQREREVLAAVADGLSNRMIGERLAISPRTVEIHRSNMLRKLDANHSSEAIRIAIEASMVGQSHQAAA